MDITFITLCDDRVCFSIIFNFRLLKETIDGKMEEKRERERERYSRPIPKSYD